MTDTSGQARELHVPTHVRARTMGDETVLLDLTTATYVGLDGVGTALWRRLGADPSLPAAIDALCERYDVGRAELSADVEHLVGQLLARGLLRDGPPPPPPAEAFGPGVPGVHDLQAASSRPATSATNEGPTSVPAAGGRP